MIAAPLSSARFNRDRQRDQPTLRFGKDHASVRFSRMKLVMNVCILGRSSCSTMSRWTCGVAVAVQATVGTSTKRSVKSPQDSIIGAEFVAPF